MAILLDNGATFRSDSVRRLCDKWGVSLVFRCAYRASGNAIVERNHRTIKRMATRSGGDILDMVYWYNVSSKSHDKESSPAGQMFLYPWKPMKVNLPEEVPEPTAAKPEVGQRVFVKPPNASCTDWWSEGIVTGDLPNRPAVEVDGVPRHVADLRHFPSESEVPMSSGTEENSPLKEMHVQSTRVLRPRSTLYPPDRFS